MTIGKKIFGGYILLITILVVIAAVAFYSFNFINRSYNKLIEVNERLADGANKLRFEIRDQVAHYRAFFLYPNEQQSFNSQLKEDYKSFTDALEKMKNLVSTTEEIDLLNDIEKHHENNMTIQGKTITMFLEGKKSEALDIAFNQLKPLTQELIDNAEKFKTLQTKMESEGIKNVESSVNGTILFMSIISLIGFAGGMVIAFLLTRNISIQLRESINQVSSSSAEISTMSSQVASGAAETATAVSETTTTVEEVKQTSQLAVQKSKYVSESAQKAAQVSQSGKKAVEETIEKMNKINEQMESIAESIVRLSEQSQAIGEIIATVNDLAEQSNLLAVNAAIEAAKAGEQGKGFTVVAQEVKSMAEQSKQATGQVRTILMDIQKATSGAVMATEQGSKAVETGIKQVSESGEAIRMLSDNITEASQAATQIAASSQQQSVGMDQIASAMENIKQASTQNVAGTKQVETAVQNLQEISRKLKKMIEK